MSRLLHLIIIIGLLLLHVGVANAQENRNEEAMQKLEQAEQDYAIGRFDRVLETLQNNLSHYQDSSRQRALRLIALCYLAQDDEKQAEYYARQLVEANNYYTGVDDPVRFEEMVDKLKRGLHVTITTASSVAEGLEEAPVPVTIITAEMIENLGYNKNLSHILAAYVPGMTDVLAEWEENISMHGAFARNQELILVMENGHRLNNRAFNSCSLDYALSTEKIDRIEVLRGPASSLYGNVALSAVVNIITKQGADIDGIKVKHGYGTYNTHKADLTMGTRFMDADIMVWCSLYQTDGQERHVGQDLMDRYRERFYDKSPAEHVPLYVERYRDRPCYDIGMSFRYKDFNLHFSRKNSRSVKQVGDTWGVYDYNRYGRFDDYKPGANRESNHAEMNYTHKWDKVTLSATAYGDWYTCNFYSPLSIEDPEDEQLPKEEQVYTHGSFLIDKTKEYTLGGTLRASANYKLGSMTGNLLVGSQFERFTLSDYSATDGQNYVDILNVSSKEFIHIKGSENSLSFYVQDKHSFTPKLLMNAGLRYDIKRRNLQNKITAWSPRLALIYLVNQSLNLKFTYARSFVDMAYYYRCEAASMEQELLPQYLNAMQLAVMGKLPQLNLSYDINISYNKYQNLYCNINNSEKRWVNEGSYENLALEASMLWTWKRLTTNLTFYWCKALRASYYYYSDDEGRVACVPNQTLNLNVGWKAIDRQHHQLKLYGNMQYIGKTMGQGQHIDAKTYLFVTKEFFLSRRVIFDAGVKYTYDQWLQLSVDCENVFNTNRYVIGPAWYMYPEYLRGRNVMASVAFKF